LSQKPNIAILVLAAGGSSRMGRPKQLLKWKHTTLIGHAIETVKQLDILKTVVVLGANHDKIKPVVEQHQIEILINKHWESGLGNSLAYGISSILESTINLDGVIIMLADQPLIDVAFLNVILNNFEIGKQQIIASVYKEDKRGVPVLFDAVYFKELSQLIDDKGAKSILQKYTNRVISVDAKELVSDIDTLEDYERLYNANH